jgi:hypothetical protein
MFVPMKVNSKKRKLDFIRRKNRIRKGTPVATLHKISLETLKNIWAAAESDTEMVEMFMSSLGKPLSEVDLLHLEAKYKLPFTFSEVKFARIGADLLHDLVSTKFTFKYNP